MKLDSFMTATIVSVVAAKPASAPGLPHSTAALGASSAKAMIIMLRLVVQLLLTALRVRFPFVEGFRTCRFAHTYKG